MEELAGSHLGTRGGKEEVLGQVTRGVGHERPIWLLPCQGSPGTTFSVLKLGESQANQNEGPPSPEAISERLLN